MGLAQVKEHLNKPAENISDGLLGTSLKMETIQSVKIVLFIFLNDLSVTQIFISDFVREVFIMVCNEVITALRLDICFDINVIDYLTCEHLNKCLVFFCLFKFCRIFVTCRYGPISF